MSTPAKGTSKKGAWIALAVIVGVLMLINAVSSDDGESGGSGDALTERTCEIFRDIAADVDLETDAETRDRLKDLYDGYGQSAPADIASPLRTLVAALTDYDYTTAATAITDVDDACSSRGL